MKYLLKLWINGMPKGYGKPLGTPFHFDLIYKTC